MPPEKMDEIDDDQDFEEYVGDEGELTGKTAADVTDKEEEVQEPSEDLGGEPDDGGTAEDDTVTATEPETEKEPEPEVDTAPSKTSYQKRIDELTQKRREAEAAAARLAAENEQLKAQKPKEPTGPIEGQPKPEDFDTYDDYYAALADFRADQKIKKWKEEEEKSRQVAFVTQKQAEFRERIKKGADSHEDFNEVVFDPAAPISQAMVDICMDIEEPAEVLYYLAKNHAEARKIAIMTPVQAGRAIGKLEAEISANLKANPKPTIKTKTDAPKPINPVRTITPVLTKDPAKMDNDEYRKWRQSGGGR